MTVVAALLGPSKAFSGNKEVFVPPGATQPYVLSFKPTKQGAYVNACLCRCGFVGLFAAMCARAAAVCVAFPWNGGR